MRRAIDTFIHGNGDTFYCGDPEEKENLTIANQLPDTAPLPDDIDYWNEEEAK